MKTLQLREKSYQELSQFLQQQKAELGRLRFGLKEKKVKNTAMLIQHKKTIARILTILREKSK